MFPRLIKFSPMAVSALCVVIATGCSPVNAENKAPTVNQNTPNQIPAKKSEDENSIWVRLAKPTCH